MCIGDSIDFWLMNVLEKKKLWQKYVSLLGKLQPPILAFMLNTVWCGFWPNLVLARTKHVQSKGRTISQRACELKIQILYRHSLLLLREGHNFAWMAWQLSWCDMNKGQTEVYYEHQNWDKNYFHKIWIKSTFLFMKWSPNLLVPCSI